MPSKKIAWGACLLIIGTASATDRTYTVQQGDTIQAIARHFSVTPASIISTNHLEHRTLRAGMVLHLAAAQTQPAGATYAVKAGDTDWALAHKLGTTIAELKKLNPAVDLQHLKPGTSLHVPAAKKAATASISTHYAIVNASHAIIRRHPGAGGEKITMVDSGIKTAVIDFENGWYKLQFPKGTVGWMRGDLLKPAPAVVAAPTVVKVAAQAKPIEKPIAQVKPEEKVPVQPKPAEKVAVQAEAPAPTVEQILNKAYRLRGSRYRYGGTSSRGFDCSGFTSTVFRSAGINLPRMSRSQATVGYAVSRGELKPGDLVFFRTHRSSRINHVGIYAGDGKFIHAASGYGAVRVDSLAKNYAREYAGARRVAPLKHRVLAAHAEKSQPKKPAPKPSVPEIPVVASPAPPKPKEQGQ